MVALLFLINWREIVHPVLALCSKTLLSIGSHTDLGLAEICVSVAVSVERLRILF